MKELVSIQSRLQRRGHAQLLRTGLLALDHTENIESDGLAERPALTDSDDISLFHTERRRAVRRDVLMSLLVTVVFGDVVQAVVPQSAVFRLHRRND